MELYHLATNTLITVTTRTHGYHLVTVFNSSGIFYRMLHDTITGAAEDAQAHYDTLGPDL